MANNYINSIDIGIRLQPKEEVKRELQSMLYDIGKQSTIDIAIDTKNIDAGFKDLQKSLDGLQNSISQLFANSQINTSQMSNEVKKTLSQLQKDAIDVFTKEAGLSMGKTLYSNFAKSVKQNWKTGEIEKILSDALKINEDEIFKMDKSQKLQVTNEALERYVNFLKEIHVLNAAGKSNGLIVSLQDVSLTKDALAEVKESFKRLVKIDDIGGIRLDRVFGEWADAARSFGFTLDGHDSLEGKLLALSRVISEYKNIKKYGMSAGSLMSDEDEEKQIQKITQAYFNLIETLEKIEKTPHAQIAIIDSDKQVKDIKKVEDEVSHLADVTKQFKNINTGNGSAVESVAKSMIGNLKSKVGEGISLGDFDDVVKSLQQVNGELVKISNIKIGDDLVRQTTQVEVGIGRIVKEIRNLTVNSSGNIIGSKSVVEPQVIVNLKEYQNAILKIDEAQRKLSELKLVDSNEVTRLKDLLDIDAIGSTNELKQYIQEVKMLGKEEQRLQQIQESIIKDRVNMYKDMFDSIEKEEKRLQQVQESITKEKTNMYKDMFDSIEKREKEYTKLFDQADKNLEKQKNQDTNLQNIEYLSNQKNVYKEIKTALQEEYRYRKLLVGAEGEYKQRLKESLDVAIARQKTAESQKVSNNLTSMAQEIALSKERIKLENELREKQGKENDNKAKDIQKEIDAYKQEQQAVQELIQKQIKLLEIKKQGMLFKDNKADTSAIDEAINKYKQLGNISMKELRNEISYINAELKAASGSADSFMGRISKSLSSVGLYVDAGDIFRSIVNGAKDAVKYVVEVENAMIDLTRVVDMSDTQAKTFQQNMHKLSLELASSSADTISAVATFSKLGYTLQEATMLGEVTSKYNSAADINDMNQATLSLISTLKAYKLDAKDAKSVTDDINEVTNKYAVTAEDINVILQNSAATMNTFGNSLQQNIALGTVANEIMQDASKVGNALKSISARITTNSNALGELEAMGISIEDMNGNLKSTYQLFEEMSDKIQKMKGEELARVANNLFGKEQMSVALAIVQNVDKLKDVMTDLEDTTGSVDREFARYLDSTDAKVRQLKENVGGLYSEFVNSDMTKGFLDGLNGIVKTFGNLPTVIAMATSALLIFKGQGLASLINTLGIAKSAVGALGLAQIELNAIMSANPFGLLALTIAGTTVMVNKLIQAEDNLIKKNKEVIDNFDSEQQSLKSAQKLLEEKAQLEQDLANTGNGTQEHKKLKEELLEVERQLANVLPNSADAYDEQGNKISTNNDLIQAQIDLKKQQLALEGLNQLKDNTTFWDNDAKSFKNLQQTFEDTIAKRDEMLQRHNKALQEGNKIQAAGTAQALEGYEKQIAKMSTEVAQRRLLILQLVECGKTYEEIARYIGEDESVVKSYANTMKDVTSASNEAKDSTNDLLREVDKLGDSLDNATDSAAAIRKATEEYADIGQSMSQVQGWIDKINKSHSVTPALQKQILKNYPAIGDAVYDVASCVDFLNNKMQSMADVQAEALLVMKGDDEAFYQDKIAHNDEYQAAVNKMLNAFISDGEQAYSVDLSHYSTFNKMKDDVMNDLGTAVENWLSQYVSTSKDGYADDFANFKSFAEAKAGILKKLQAQIDKFENALADNVKTIEEGKSNVASAEAEKLYSMNVKKFNEQIERLQAAKAEIETTFNDVEVTTRGFSGGSIGTGSSKGSGGSKGSKGGKSETEKAAEKAKQIAEKIRELQSNINVDRYLDLNQVLESVNNEITALKTEQESLSGAAYQQSLVREIELLGSKQSALVAINEEQKRESEELKQYLSQYGFYFDATGQLINSQQRLLEIQKSVNAMGGNTEEELKKKQEWVDWVKELQDKTKSYCDLVNSKIPSVANQWNELGNSIRNAQLSMLEGVRDKLADAVYQELQKEVDRLKDEARQAQEDAKEALEEEKKSEIAILDKRIKKLKDELAALDDESGNKKEKLAKLKEELAKWNKDDSAFANKQIADLKEQIASLEKDIEKDNIKDKINSLEEEKGKVEDYYKDELKDLETKHKEEMKIKEKAWEEMLSKEKAYQEADKLLKAKNMTEITKLLSSYAENFKDIGTLLGTNFAEALNVEIKGAMDSLDSLLGQTTNHSTVTGNNASNSSNTDKYVWVDEGATTRIFTDSTGTKSKGTLWENGIASADKLIQGERQNGFYEIFDLQGNSLGWVDAEKVRKWNNISAFATGGRTPSNIGQDGALSILHANEAILNAKDTEKLDAIYKNVVVSQNLLDRLSSYLDLSNKLHEPIMPNYDYNRILGGNTTNNNEQTVTVNNEINITNNTKDDSYFNARSLEKMFKNQIRTFG